MPFVVFEISSGAPLPPDAIKVSEKADVINRYDFLVDFSYSNILF